ncbi:MAG: IclR family transcriptional regulator [Burkholderiales bacterium PBB5]|nr:MAG: IclR family transcriptional regulator [Burkholderiales bacterium PBB5]
MPRPSPATAEPDPALAATAEAAESAPAAPGGAAAVDRALALLAAFRTGDGVLSLAQLAQRTGLYKSTALRLLASLVHARLLQRLPEGGYTLGAEVARLNAVYAASFSLQAQVLPVLQALVARSRESVAFHVRRGDQRLCLFRVDSPQLLRDHTRAGDLLPLDRGAGGRVLMAFAGAPGAVHERIRRDGVAVLTGDRVPELTGISAPVWDASGALVGALTMTLPEQRMQPDFVPAVQDAARQLTATLGGLWPWR